MAGCFTVKGPGRKRSPKPPDAPNDMATCCGVTRFYSGKIRRPAYDMSAFDWVVPTKEETCDKCKKTAALETPHSHRELLLKPTLTVGESIKRMDPETRAWAIKNGYIKVINP